MDLGRLFGAKRAGGGMFVVYPAIFSTDDRLIANISFGFRLMLVPNMMTVYLTCECDREIAKETLKNILHTLKTVNSLSYASSRIKAGEDEGSIS